MARVQQKKLTGSGAIMDKDIESKTVSSAGTRPAWHWRMMLTESP